MNYDHIVHYTNKNNMEGCRSQRVSYLCSTQYACDTYLFAHELYTSTYLLNLLYYELKLGRASPPQ